MAEIVNGNPLDKNTSKKTRVKTTRFPLNQRIFGTYRFGEEGVFLVHDGLAGDKSTQIRSASNIDTYTLKAPLLNTITMNKTIIQVNRCAILPNAWEKIFVNPSIGEDIDAAEYGTSVKAENFTYFIEEILTRLKNALTLAYDTITTNEDMKEYIEALITAEYIFSRGSLINAMGANLAALWYHKNGASKFSRSYDIFLEDCLNFDGYIEFTHENKQYVVEFSDNFETNTSATKVTKNEFLNLFRENAEINVTAFEYRPQIELSEYIDEVTFFEETMKYDRPFDIAPLWAYQMAIAEFFTNDKVDYIYNAEIFRQYIKNLWLELLQINGSTQESYNYNINGIIFENDALNSKVFNYISENINTTSSSGKKIVNAYLNILFGYRRSLKYKDYFTGARTRPIAIGNTNIEVTAGEDIEIIDIVKNIQKQRFLNIVNKIPRDLKGYTKGIFGKDVAPDWHNPLFICRVSEPIYGQEVENTGAAQFENPVSRTTVLKNQGRKLQFTLNGFDRNCILIGFIDFDIARAYSDGVTRNFMHVDRFDMFNPYLQYTGDQEIYMEELDAAQTGTFGYTGPYMEYKQKVNRAFGGFITALPGWTFLNSYVGDTTNELERPNTKPIGPDFIRSKSTELDKFYLSLTGHSLANYFHFIIDTYNEISAVRPMAYDPQILG